MSNKEHPHFDSHGGIYGWLPLVFLVSQLGLLLGKAVGVLPFPWWVIFSPALVGAFIVYAIFGFTLVAEADEIAPHGYPLITKLFIMFAFSPILTIGTLFKEDRAILNKVLPVGTILSVALSEVLTLILLLVI